MRRNEGAVFLTPDSQNWVLRNQCVQHCLPVSLLGHSAILASSLDLPFNFSQSFQAYKVSFANSPTESFYSPSINGIVF